jgi:hypothetical protein
MAEAPIVFLSYASEDNYWVDAFRASPAFKGIGDVHVLDYAAVEFWDPAARLELIERSAAVIAFVSADYRNKQWTIAEWERALTEAQRCRLVFVPIMLDADAIAWWEDQRQRGKLTALPRDYAYVSFTDADGRRLEIRPEDTQVNSLIARLAWQIKQELAMKFQPLGARPAEVHVGASSPPVVSPGETFVARFAAYTDANRDKVKAVIEQEAPTSQLRLDLDRCRWRRGTKATVRLECGNAMVTNPVQTFSWDASYKMLRFDVTVADYVTSDTLILRFDVAVEGMPIISLRPEIKIIKRDQQHKGAAALASFVEVRAPKSAFASYVASDRREVLGRIRSLQISKQINVFLDCLSIRPGEQWKPKLRDEIVSRDIFWLFWSREAMKSSWPNFNSFSVSSAASAMQVFDLA